MAKMSLFEIFQQIPKHQKLKVWIDQCNIQELKACFEKGLMEITLSNSLIVDDFGNYYNCSDYARTRHENNPNDNTKVVLELVENRIKLEEFVITLKALIKGTMVSNEKDIRILEKLKTSEPELIKLLFKQDFSDILYSIMRLKCFKTFGYLVDQCPEEAKKYVGKDGEHEYNLLQDFIKSTYHNFDTQKLDEYKSILKVLVKIGVDINAAENSMPPLIMAMNMHNDELVELIVNEGADLRNEVKCACPDKSHGSISVASIAFERGSLSVLKRIIAKDPKILEMDESLPTSLNKMCEAKYKSACIALVRPYVKFKDTLFVTLDDLKKDCGIQSDNVYMMAKSYKQKMSLKDDMQIVVENSGEYMVPSESQTNFQSTHTLLNNLMQFMFAAMQLGEESDPNSEGNTTASGPNGVVADNSVNLGVDSLGDNSFGSSGDCDNSI